MGEIAEMILDGTLCQHCGSAIPEEAEGFTRTCHACRVEHSKSGNAKSQHVKDKCPYCGKWVKRIGMDNHIKDAHGPEMVGEFARIKSNRDELLDVAQSIIADDMLQYLPAEYVAKVRSVIARSTGK